MPDINLLYGFFYLSLTPMVDSYIIRCHRVSTFVAWVVKRRFKFSNACNFFIYEQKHQVWVSIALLEIKCTFGNKISWFCWIFYFSPFCSGNSVWEPREEGTVLSMACIKKNRSLVFSDDMNDIYPHVHRFSRKLGKPRSPLECWTLVLVFSCPHWNSVMDSIYPTWAPIRIGWQESTGRISRPPYAWLRI